MVNKRHGIIILLISLFFLVSCDLLDLPNEGGILDHNNDKEVAITSISDLENTDYFREGALENNQCRSEEHTSELQSRFDLVCRLLLERNKEELTTLPSFHQLYQF